MAEAREYSSQNVCRECCAICARSTARTQVTTHAQTARRSLEHFRVVRDIDTGREQPPGSTPGQDRPQYRGVAHAPAPSVTPAKCLSCAAQNAALGVRFLSLQLVGVERLATAAFADTGSSTIGFDWQFSVPELRQPPLFVAAPLAASAVSESESKNQGGKALRKPR